MADQYSPEDWGAQVDYDSWPKGPAATQVFLHWLGTPAKDACVDGNINSEKAALRSAERFHLSKGWKGLAYDYAVGNSGTVYRVRGHARSAATSGDVDADGVSNNAEGDAIVFLVGQGQAVSNEAYAAATALIESFGKRDFYGHREAKGTRTSCPGDEIMGFVESLRAPKKKTSKAPKKPSTKKASASNWTDQIVADLGTWKRGQRGPAVRRIQALVNLSGLTSLRPDGIFGPQTERAVSEYQGHFRLVIDGIVGPKTWTHMLTTEKF